MDMKGVGSWASSRHTEFNVGLDTGKRLGRLGLSRRIVTASDDPSGAGIAARMRARAYAFGQTRDNAARGMDLTRSTSGALDGIGDSLTRMRELAMQSANGALSAADHASLDAEFQSLKQGITSQLDGEFNGIKMFSGNAVSVAINPDGKTPVQVTMPDGAELDQVQTLSVGSVSASSDAIGELDAALDSVASMQANLGANQSALSSTLQGQAEAEMQLARAESRIADADVARESSGLAAANLLEHATVAMQLHSQMDALRGGDLLSAPF